MHIHLQHTMHVANMHPVAAVNSCIMKEVPQKSLLLGAKTKWPLDTDFAHFGKQHASGSPDLADSTS